MGRVLGHRGAAGEVTVKVAGGDAALWAGVGEVRLRGPEEAGERRFLVEAARAYRDRLVLKLRGIEGPQEAAALRGALVAVALAHAPDLPEGRYWASSLPGLEVHDERHGRVGVVRDVLPTGGTDLLVVESAAGQELLIPMAPEILLQVDFRAGAARVRLPEGLLELNRREEREA